ncbi:MAG: hypothetical protein K2O89_06720 [Clostridia bacterium]|nr:hypothetical protein [Clostridia bacterium]
MAKKKKFIKETTIENYYDLKVDKVDELVAALKDETPATAANDLTMFISDCTGVDDPNNYTRSGKKKEFDPYKTDFLGKIPVWIKALFIKWWFAGLVCYFVMFGIQQFMNGDPLDAIVLTGFVLGLVVELFVNPIFRYMEHDDGEYNSYIMFPFPFKAYWTFFTNILYYIVVALVMYFGFYLGLNELINCIKGTENVIALGVEPLLFGTFCVVADMIFIGIKDLIVYLVKKSKKEKAANV